MAVAQYLNRGGDGARRREIVTPEGIPIQFTLASVSERFTALFIDVVIQIAVLIAIGIVVGLAAAGSGRWLMPLMVLVAFFIRHFYFTYFEIRDHGATPGKRAAGIRVIDARGGSLEASAVLARNLVRELELWMPLTYIIAHDQVWPDAPTWMWVLASTWIVVIALMPVFNRDRLRVGDMIGGTLVVVQPKTQLRIDLADVRVAAPPPRLPLPNQVAAALKVPAPAAPAAPAAMFVFTEAQLDIYGIYELQVLEGLLRGEAAADPGAYGAVADKIRTKLAYGEAVPPHLDERFLHDFYTALRAHLEKRLLFGKRRADKFDRAK